MEEAGFNEEETEELRRLIDSKDYLGLKEIIKGKIWCPAQRTHSQLTRPVWFSRPDRKC